MIVTIDGPAGAGKSTVAKALARRLGYDFLDTGAMYRAVTLAGLRARIDFSDQNAIARLVPSINVEMPPGRVLLSGEDVTSLIRTKEITAASGAIASSHAVRLRLVALQRTIAKGRDFVCEGRDQGTVVFPEALCKFFLTADRTERAKRRQGEMAKRGEVVTLQDVLMAQDARDARDAARDMGPMVAATDAVLLDTTKLTLDQVVDAMEHHVRSRLAGATS
ncbi:MAG TPA: (d)CMP kinase [Gemmataceae bacterium]|nr:(d)CMP kinase [Gemmataceae bacterium]